MAKKVVTDNVTKIQNLLQTLQPEIDAINKEEEVLEKRRDKLAKLVGNATAKFKSPDDCTDETEAEEEQLVEILGEFAYDLGRTWSGDWNSGDGWSVGDRAEFWVASTC